MGEYSFRQAVRDEVWHWMDQQKVVVPVIVDALAKAIGPLCEVEVTRKMMVRLGQLDNDERDSVQALLNEVRTLLARVRVRPSTTFPDDPQGCDNESRRLTDAVNAMLAKLEQFRAPGGKGGQ